MGKPTLLRQPALTRFARSVAQGLSQLWYSLSPLARGLSIAWIAAMVFVPIVKWIWGTLGLDVSVVVTVLLQSSAVVALLMSAASWRRVVACLTLIVVGAWLVEAVGVSTGLPFGPYYYTAKLQPQLAAVPILIPLAWLMMLPPAWAVATIITKRSADWRSTLVAGAAFTAWDLFLDPQMVAWGYWCWQQPGAYFGIPWINFFGWFVCATVLSRLAWPVLGDPLPRQGLQAIYTVTWVLQTIGQLVFWDLPGPAVVGSVVMGFFVWMSSRSLDSVKRPKDVSTNPPGFCSTHE